MSMIWGKLIHAKKTKAIAAISFAEKELVKLVVKVKMSSANAPSVNGNAFLYRPNEFRFNSCFK